MRYLPLLVAAILLGCGEPAVPPQLTLDSQIEQEWAPGRERVDAIPFFENGGCFQDNAPTDNPRFDKDVILPLLKLLVERHQLKFDILVEEPGYAFALVAEPGSGAEFRNKIRRTIRDFDAGTPALVIDNWGRTRMTLEFMGEEEISAMEAAGGLQILEEELAGPPEAQ